ncbi:MAG: hypothetical protein CFE34_19825 [Rhodobacteraceae bacterium PARR1]|nr:MAG: hypothetical protein CFE34_19825 [Rhodobacteraceae bacterium PARR1]
MVWNMLDGLEGHPQGRHSFDYLVVTAEADAETLLGRLTEDGSAARCWTAQAGVLQGPEVAHLGALVLDGDHCGGVPEAMALARRIMADGPHLPMVILLAGLTEQVFPCNPRVDPVLLRKPLSRLTMRVTRDYLVSNGAGDICNGAQPFPVRPV